jgi:hypothetical protein
VHNIQFRRVDSIKEDEEEADDKEIYPGVLYSKPFDLEGE